MTGPAEASEFISFHFSKTFLIIDRIKKLDVSLVFLSAKPVMGEVFFPSLNHLSIDDRSYVNPSAKTTGSVIKEWLIGQRNSDGRSSSCFSSGLLPPCGRAGGWGEPSSLDESSLLAGSVMSSITDLITDAGTRRAEKKGQQSKRKESSRLSLTHLPINSERYRQSPGRSPG